MKGRPIKKSPKNKDLTNHKQINKKNTIRNKHKLNISDIKSAKCKNELFSC